MWYYTHYRDSENVLKNPNIKKLKKLDEIHRPRVLYLSVQRVHCAWHMTFLMESPNPKKGRKLTSITAIVIVVQFGFHKRLLSSDIIPQVEQTKPEYQS